MVQGEPFDVLGSGLGTLETQVTELEQRLRQAEARAAEQAQVNEPWWRQRIGPVPSGLIVGAIGVFAVLGWWRSRKRSTTHG